MLKKQQSQLVTIDYVITTY